MGMERYPGAIWVLCIAILSLMGIMYAKAYVLTIVIVCIGGAGSMGLKRLAEYDPSFFKIMFQRLKYEDNYPAHNKTKAQ